jgi:hypothetical protein
MLVRTREEHQAEGDRREWSNDNPARRVFTDGAPHIALKIDFTEAEGRIVAGKAPHSNGARGASDAVESAPVMGAPTDAHPVPGVRQALVEPVQGSATFDRIRKRSAGSIGGGRGDMRLGKWLVLALALGLGAAPGRSATINVDRSSPATTFIEITGPLELGDEKKFVSAVLSVDNAIVGLESPGGNLHAGIEIGKAIRLKGFTTYVMPDATCTSACALAWLGGTPRALSRYARIGFHAASDREQNVTSAGNALVGSYLNYLGLPTSAIVFITAANPREIFWLTDDLAQRHGISFKLFDPDDDDRPASAPAPQAAAPPPTSFAPAAPVAPQRRSEPLPADFRQRTEYFLQRHFAAMSSGNNDQALTYLITVYGDRVDYFGEMKGRAEVIANNARFIERWPSRQYRLRGAPESIACHIGVCDLTAVIDWVAVSGPRRARSEGSSRVNMRIDFVTHQDGRIVSENSTTLERRITRQ